MSESACNVCLGGYDGSVEFFYEREQVARKGYRCQECSRPILKGSRYKRIGGKCEGQMWHERLCVLCYEINTVFSCNNGTEWGNFWEAMHDYVLPGLTVSSPCFNKLSMGARALVTEEWWKWKELHAG